MTTTKINSTLQQAATIWQLLFGIGSVLVTVTVFMLSLRADVNANKKDISRQDETIKAVIISRQRDADKSELNQMKILEAINEIRLQLKDKTDRK